jgi:hypothetical protein
MNPTKLAPTPCEDCEHVHPDTRSKPSYQWMCMRFPRLEGLDPVAPTTRIIKEPYNRCAAINAGWCPLFERRRDGQMELAS